MKNFLEPTKTKIILSLVFFVILNFISVVPCMRGDIIDAENTLNFHWSICKPIDSFMLGGFIDILGIGHLGLGLARFEFWGASLYLIVISYLLSSVIYYFFRHE